MRHRVGIAFLGIFLLHCASRQNGFLSADQVISESIHAIHKTSYSCLLYEKCMPVWFTENSESIEFIKEEFGNEAYNRVSKSINNERYLNPMSGCKLLSKIEIDSIVLRNKEYTDLLMNSTQEFSVDTFIYYYQTTCPIFITDSVFMIQLYYSRMPNIGSGCTYFFKAKSNELELLRKLDCYVT